MCYNQVFNIVMAWASPGGGPWRPPPPPPPLFTYMRTPPPPPPLVESAESGERIRGCQMAPPPPSRKAEDAHEWSNVYFQFQSGVCYYKIVAISGSNVLTFPSVKPLPQNGGQFNITISLPPNKHFTSPSLHLMVMETPPPQFS